MPTYQGSSLLDYFAVVRPYSFAIRKALSATREKAISLDSSDRRTGVERATQRRGQPEGLPRSRIHRGATCSDAISHPYPPSARRQGEHEMLLSPRTRLDVFGLSAARLAVLSNGTVPGDRSWEWNLGDPSRKLSHFSALCGPRRFGPWPGSLRLESNLFRPADGGDVGDLRWFQRFWMSHLETQILMPFLPLPCW